MTQESLQNIRVRFAPSPTGFLHVGGARTAIFNWLFARKNNGAFLLRIEDTDQARSGQEMVQAIYDGLQWLGLDWDEEPIFQSTRFDQYQKQAHHLIEKGLAYKCFCSPERLKALREKLTQEKGGAYKYDRRCLNLSAEEVAAKEREGVPFVIRFKVPEGQTAFEDEVYGAIKVEHAQVDDFIILRSDGVPTYHLAVVVDDHAMQISHVIRGDDHLSNTPKHVLLFDAFGWPRPQFVHVPLILGPDKQRLSKRHGATAIGEYRRSGYLSEAMLNFLTLLGWSPGDDRELFGRDELIQAFDLSGISKKSAIFDEKKLEWMNGQYFNGLPPEALFDRVVPELIDEGLLSEEEAETHRGRLLKIIELIKPRVLRLPEFRDRTRYFFESPKAYDEKGMQKHWKAPEQVERFKTLLDRFDALSDFNAGSIEPVFRELAEEWDVGLGKVIHPVRLALTGVTFSPGMFEVMELLGKDAVMSRLEKAKAYLQANLVSRHE